MTAANTNRTSGATSIAGRIASILHLDNPAAVSDVALARLVSKGLHPVSATAVNDFVRICASGRRNDIVSKSTLGRSRLTAKPLSRQMSQRLYNIARFMEAAQRHYGSDVDAMVSWCSRPQPSLDDETPLDVARLGAAGTTAVVRHILLSQSPPSPLPGDNVRNGI